MRRTPRNTLSAVAVIVVGIAAFIQITTQNGATAPNRTIYIQTAALSPEPISVPDGTPIQAPFALVPVEIPPPPPPPAPPAPTPLAASHQQSVKPSRSATPTGGSHRGYATVEECISMVENGGDYGRSSNPSHFGRYQFDRNAWADYGGDPADWGTASPAEQDRVFANAMAAGAYSRWTPYDGCG